jgi:short-subunit dehydrogenase
MNIIISGASRGIGKAIAGVFAGEGHRIFICSRGEMPLYKTMEELTTRFPAAEIKAMPADLGRREEAEKFADWCLQSGAPDILVNNAGLFEPGEVHSEADGVLENQIAVNLYSAYYLTRRLLPAMMEKKSGHIFNICSIASLDAYRNGGAYSISKFALYGFHKNLRKEMMPYGIKVTALFPGAVMTDSWSGFDNSAHRIMNPEDIAGLVHACSRLSPAACVEEIVVRPLQGDL